MLYTFQTSIHLEQNLEYIPNTMLCIALMQFDLGCEIHSIEIISTAILKFRKNRFIFTWTK